MARKAKRGRKSEMGESHQIRKPRAPKTKEKDREQESIRDLFDY